MILQKQGPATAATVNRPDKFSNQLHTDTLGSAEWQGLTYPTTEELERLSAHGVPPDAMAEPWPIRSARMVLDGLYGFDFNHDGESALIFKAEDRGEPIDLVAWQPSTGKFVSWHGNTFCLGDLDQIDNPATYFMGGALRVHADPLGWLRAYREGIVILRRDLTHAYLRNVRRLSFADTAYAQQVQQWLEPPKPSVELFVEVQGELAA
jgi:hypothetical protein